MYNRVLDTRSETLADVLRHFERPSATLAAAQAAYDAGSGWRDRIVRVAEGLGDAVRDEWLHVSRFVATAGDRLAALEQAWQRGGAGGRGRADADCAALQRQVSGACCVIHGCTVLAIQGGAAPEACSRLLASASLMVGSGRRALVAALVASDDRLATTVAASQVCAMVGLLHMLATHPACRGACPAFVAGPAPPQAFARWLRALVDALLALGGRPAVEGGGLAVALEHYTGLCTSLLMNDSYVLGGLHAAAQSDAALCERMLRLLVLHSLPAAAAKGGLLPAPGGQGGAAAADDDAAPPRGEGGKHPLSFLCSLLWLLTAGCLKAPLVALMHGPEAMAPVRLAAAALQRLPAQCPAGLPPLLFWSAHVALASMLRSGRDVLALCECCRAARPHESSLGDADAAAWRVVGLVPRAAAVIRQAAAELRAPAPAPAPAAGGNQATDGAAAHSTVLAAPRREVLADILASLARTWIVALQLAVTVRSVESVAQVEAYVAAADAGLRLLPLLAGLQAEREVAAGGTGSTGTGGTTMGEDIPIGQEFATLADLLVVVWSHLGTLAAAYGSNLIDEQKSCTHAQPQAPPCTAAYRSLAPRLYHLHATAARAVHWAAAAAPGQAAELPLLRDWPRMLGPTSLDFSSALACSTLANIEDNKAAAASRSGDDGGDSGSDDGGDGRPAPRWPLTDGDLRRMCAAHAALLHMAAARLPPAGLLHRFDSGLQEQVLLNLAHAAGYAPPACVTPELESALVHGLRQLAAAEPTRLRLGIATHILHATSFSAHAAAALVRGGSLPPLLALARRCMASPEPPTQVQVLVFLQRLLVLLSRLDYFGDVSGDGGEEGSLDGRQEGSPASRQQAGGAEAGAEARLAAARSGSGGDGGHAGASGAAGPPARAPVAVPAAREAGRLWDVVVEAMEALDEALEGAHEAAATLASFERQVLERLLPLAEAVAELLYQRYQQPEQVEAARLELARSAVGRSCAYLGCANLGGLGGGAAGQGEGSQRCSGCRVAWYCGTACSHADWRRGGHRRVCKALAAERRAQQQQRQQEEG